MYYHTLSLNCVIITNGMSGGGDFLIEASCKTLTF